MRFTYKEQEYVIAFEHHNPQQRTTVKAIRHMLSELQLPKDTLAQLAPRKRKLRPFTRCTISTVDRTATPPTETPFIIGETRLRTGEQYCKSTGRSYAITRALEQIGDETMRELAWNAYKNRATIQKGASS